MHSHTIRGTIGIGMFIQLSVRNTNAHHTWYKDRVCGNNIDRNVLQQCCDDCVVMTCWSTMHLHVYYIKKQRKMYVYVTHKQTLIINLVQQQTLQQHPHSNNSKDMFM